MSAESALPPAAAGAQRAPAFGSTVPAALDPLPDTAGPTTDPGAPVDTDTDTDTGALPDRIAREHLRLAQRQVGRIPLAYLLIDGFLCWLVVRLGLPLPALVWVLALLSVQLVRWLLVRGLQADQVADPRPVLRRLSQLLLGLGLLRVAMVPLVFSQPVHTEHYMFTLVYLGMIAGTSASVGGQLRPFVAYGALVGGSLAVAWAWAGGPAGAWVGTLIVCLLVVLALHLRDQAMGLRQFVKLALDNERLAESLRAARDASEAASQSKTRFFAAASHDLRQPLHALAINATTLELLATRQANPLIKDLSHSINRALAQSNGLLDSLLEISNLDANAVRPQLQVVDITALLTAVREEFAALAAQKGLALQLDLPDAGGGPVLAQTDPTLLRRILINLVGNALKFTARGSVTLRVLRPAPAPGRPAWLRLVVEDTGPGMAPAEQVHVFEEFYQINNTARDRSLGLGLGLAIVRRTAGLLDAPLRLRSAPGQGTALSLDLPPALAGALPAADLPGTQLVAPGMLAGLRVLVVDDELEIQRSLQGLLGQLGCEVHCAGGSAEALAGLDAGFRPQLLLVDHRLRGEQGTEVIQALQTRLGPVPAVVVTGDTEPALIQRARAAGHRVVHKPVQGQVLARVMLELVPGLASAVPLVRPAGSA